MGRIGFSKKVGPMGYESAMEQDVKSEKLTGLGDEWSFPFGKKPRGMHNGWGRLRKMEVREAKKTTF